MQDDLLNHLIDIKSGIADLNARMENVEHAVGGNGQPGLAQKVEELQAANNRLWGAGALLGLLGSVLEWLFHHGTHR